MNCANFEHARSVAMWGTRRRWGMTHLREHARLLLSGMQRVGGNGERREAPRRRTALPAHHLPVVLGLRPRLMPQSARAREPGLGASP